MTDANTFYDPIMADLIPGYVKSQKKTLASLAEAVRARNFVLVGEIGHRIKGSAACYGFTNYGDLAIEIEGVAKLEKYGECARILDLMHKEF